MDFLDRLRALPSETKTRYAFFTAACVTGLITLMWVIALPARFEDTSVSQLPDTEAIDESLPQFLEESTDEIGSVIDDVLKNAPSQTMEDQFISDTLIPAATTTPTTTTNTHAATSTHTDIRATTTKTIAVPVRPVSTSTGTAIIKIGTTSVQKSQ